MKYLSAKEIREQAQIGLDLAKKPGVKEFMYWRDLQTPEQRWPELVREFPKCREKKVAFPSSAKVSSSIVDFVGISTTITV